MKYIIKTKRLGLRYICKEDFDELSEFLQDINVMYAWEHAFSDREVSEWIDKNLDRYKKDGYSYFAAINLETNKLVGVMGPLVERINNDNYIGIAYILKREEWKKGYAIEGASACVKYAFDILGAKKVIAEIRPENISSQSVAKKLGMSIEGQFTKHYNGKDMVHLIYSCTPDTFAL